MRRGIFWPSFILCRSYTTSEKRTGWRVVKQFDGLPTSSLPKEMVTSMHGHEDMIDYMSTYRTQDKMKGKHYVPYGGLFWFTCNRYGDLTGSCFFIKQVPDTNLMHKSYMGRGYRKVINRQKERPRLPERLSRDENLVENILHEKKLRLKQ